jgi:glutathione S-transferase
VCRGESFGELAIAERRDRRDGYALPPVEQSLADRAPSLKLYYVAISHPANAARLMLDYKGLAYRRVDLRPGFQVIVTRVHRFKDITVPALTIDGERVQGSIAIAQALERLEPDPPLYPQDPGLRAAVEEAEAWGERELQPVPRHLYRWALISKPELLEPFVAEHQRLRPAGPIAKAQRPGLTRFMRAHGVTDERVRSDMQALPGMLERVRGLLDAGVLGGERLNAADFQIATSLRAIEGLDDLRPLVDARLDDYARSIWPDTEIRLPAVLPPDWAPAPPVQA